MTFLAMSSHGTPSLTARTATSTLFSVVQLLTVAKRRIARECRPVTLRQLSPKLGARLTIRSSIIVFHQDRRSFHVCESLPCLNSRRIASALSASDSGKPAMNTRADAKP